MKCTSYKFAGILFMVMLALQSPAWAHAYLDHAEPRVGATVDKPPAQIKIWFTDDVDLSGCSIEVHSADGKPVDTKNLRLDAKDDTVLIADLPALSAGTYAVTWHAKCTSGHLTQGDYKFTVK